MSWLVVQFLPTTILQKDKLINAIDIKHKSEDDTNYIEPLSKKIIQDIIPLDQQIYFKMLQKLYIDIFGDYDMAYDPMCFDCWRQDLVGICLDFKLSVREFKQIINKYLKTYIDNKKLDIKKSQYQDYKNSDSYITDLIILTRLFLLGCLKFRLDDESKFSDELNLAHDIRCPVYFDDYITKSKVAKLINSYPVIKENYQPFILTLIDYILIDSIYKHFANCKI